MAGGACREIKKWSVAQLAGDDRPGNSGSVRRLVIVGRPPPGIAGYLGPNYIVESSQGTSATCPGRCPSGQVQGGEVGPHRCRRRQRLRTALCDRPRQEGRRRRTQSLLKDVDELYLATDGDREGEALAWHLLQSL